MTSRNTNGLRILRNSVFYGMDIRVSATELARRLGDVLGRIRYRGDSFVVERNGEPVARVVPLIDRPTATLGEVLESWTSMGPPDKDFARVLEEVGAADRPPGDPWGS
jgi:prevent-host-death family protein